MMIFCRRSAQYANERRPIAGNRGADDATPGPRTATLKFASRGSQVLMESLLDLAVIVVSSGDGCLNVGSSQRKLSARGRLDRFDQRRRAVDRSRTASA